MLLTRVAISAVTAVAVAIVALVDTLPPPEGVWPVTVSGWIGLFVAFLSLGGVIWTMHRSGVERARKEASDEARMTALDTALNDFRIAVETSLNGFGKRIEQLEKAGNDDRSVVNGVLQSIAETRADRKHMGESLQRIELSLAELRRQFADLGTHGR